MGSNRALNLHAINQFIEGSQPNEFLAEGDVLILNFLIIILNSEMDFKNSWNLKNFEVESCKDVQKMPGKFVESLKGKKSYQK